MGADSNRVGPGRATALFMAAQEGHCDIVRLLCDANADTESAAACGLTPLLVAAQQGHLKVTQMLAEAGAVTHGSNMKAAELTNDPGGAMPESIWVGPLGYLLLFKFKYSPS